MSVANVPRIAGDLRKGTTVAADDVTWTKVNDRWWDDGNDNRVNNRAMDTKLYLGATIVIDVIDLETEEIRAYELEPGDYVVVTQGFYETGGPSYFEENRSHQLWRVAGWTWHGPNTSTVMLDAPEGRLCATSREMHGEEGGDMDPVQLYVDPDDVFRLVVPGQQHETWSWDWSDEYTFVDPR